MAATRYDCIIPDGAINSAFQLCDFLLICVKEENGVPLWCMLRSRFTTREDHRGHPTLKFWKFDVVKCPSQDMRSGQWHDDGIDLDPLPYYIERNATEARPETIYKTMISRTKRYLQTRDGDRIYEYTMTDFLRILPAPVYYVAQGKDLASQWHYKMPITIVAPLPIAQPLPAHLTVAVANLPVAIPIQRAVQKNKLPKHVFEVFANAAIGAKEECPILMEPFTRESICCGPCGHLFIYEALVQELERSHKCPTCRCEMCADEIQKF